MVKYIILVITTLVILSSVGIVSTQDELEHRLAVDCEDKGTHDHEFSFEVCPNMFVVFQFCMKSAFVAQIINKNITV